MVITVPDALYQQVVLSRQTKVTVPSMSIYAVFMDVTSPTYPEGGEEGRVIITFPSNDPTKGVMKYYEMRPLTSAV